MDYKSLDKQIEGIKLSSSSLWCLWMYWLMNTPAFLHSQTHSRCVTGFPVLRLHLAIFQGLIQRHIRHAENTRLHIKTLGYFGI